MKFISHRGNIETINAKEENNPIYIEKAIKLGFEVEIDFRVHNNNLYLGHDKNQYLIDQNFLTNHSSKIWIHAKNDESLKYLLEVNEDLNYFWHEEDSYTITSKGYVWTHFDKNSELKKNNFSFSNKTILTLPELSHIYKFDDILKKNYCGICSDNIIYYKNLFDENK